MVRIGLTDLPNSAPPASYTSAYVNVLILGYMTNDVVNFCFQVQIKYMFEEQQHLKFDVYDVDSNTRDLSQHDFLGSCTVTLGQVVSAPAVLDLMHPKYNKGTCGSLIVSCEELSTCKDELQLQFLAKKLDKKGLYSFKQF